jgi:hypothetical protein
MNPRNDPNKPAIEQPGQNQQPDQRPEQTNPDRSKERQDGGTSQPRRTDIEREDKLPKDDE